VVVGFRYDSVAWRRVRREVLRRDDWRCRLGGLNCQVAAVEVHHRVAVADGGSVYDESNLISVCRPCHLETRRARLAGGRVPPSREW
jgi:5-methylcytosine-specific restriction endonuclease McrA